MLIFTYNDYLECTQSKKVQKEIKKETKRQGIVKKQVNKRDSIIEKSIEKKEKVVNLINYFYKTKSWNITKESIKRYDKKINNNVITYKIKSKEVYFMITIQKEPNYNLAYKILTECIEFIKEWKNEKQNKVKFPIIIPIIIYIGEKNWNIKSSTKIRYTSFKENGINLSYNIIDLKKYRSEKYN